MRKHLVIVISILAFSACSGIKVLKLLKRGEVKQKAFKVEVPFEMRLGLVVLKVKVNGLDCDFLLDTGAPNVISKELAQKLNLMPATNRKVGDSQGNKSSLGFTTVKDISVGGVDFLETGAAIADLRASTEIACFKVDGFIGSNLMRNALWQFDYEKQIITIASSRDSLNIPSSANKIKFRAYASGIPFIDLKANGIVETGVTVDLGSNGDIALTADIFNKLKKDPSVSTTYSYGQETAGLYGKGAPDTTKYALVRELDMGKLKLNNIPVSFTTKNAKTVGTNFFKNYRLIFDWRKSELLLINVKPYDEAKTPKYGFRRTYRDNKLYVGLVFAGRDNGLKLGDQLLEINGADYRNCDPGTCWCETMYKPIETENASVLVLREGKELHFTVNKDLLFKTK